MKWIKPFLNSSSFCFYWIIITMIYVENEALQYFTVVVVGSAMFVCFAIEDVLKRIEMTKNNTKAVDWVSKEIQGFLESKTLDELNEKYDNRIDVRKHFDDENIVVALEMTRMAAWAHAMLVIAVRPSDEEREFLDSLGGDDETNKNKHT